MLEILPLTEKDIENYIDKMIILKKFKKSDKETFMQQAQALIEKGFLNNFLVLSLLVNIYKAEKELPENKIDLYKKCFEYIAKKREEEKSKIEYDWNKIYPLMKDSTFISLSVLAAPNNKDIHRDAVEELLLKHYKTKYPDEGAAEIAIKEFLEFCSNRTELFVPSSVDDKYKFFHRSFFEYFYARFIHQQPDVKEMYKLMSKFDIDSEVFELSVALVKEDQEEKYQRLVEYIFEKVEEEFNSTDGSSIAFGILTLSMQVIDDAYFIRKYYDIIIKYSNLIAQNQISHLYSKLICMWLEKEMDTNETKQKEFINTFQFPCIIYLLKIFSELHTSSKAYLKHLEDVLKKKDKELEIDYAIQIGKIGMRNHPFYVSVYNKYGSLYDLMEENTNISFNSLFTQINIQCDKETKSLIKNGYNYYTKLPTKEKKSLLQLFCQTGK